MVILILIMGIIWVCICVLQPNTSIINNFPGDQTKKKMIICDEVLFVSRSLCIENLCQGWTPAAGWWHDAGWTWHNGIRTSSLDKLVNICVTHCNLGGFFNFENFQPLGLLIEGNPNVHDFTKYTKKLNYLTHDRLTTCYKSNTTLKSSL